MYYIFYVTKKKSIHTLVILCNQIKGRCGWKLDNTFVYMNVFDKLPYLYEISKCFVYYIIYLDLRT